MAAEYADASAPLPNMPKHTAQFPNMPSHLGKDPEVAVYEDFATPEECLHIRQLAQILFREETL
jgi:hypothetical protein